MKEKLDLLVKNAEEKAKEIKSEADYLNIKSLFLGKKSELSEYMAGIKEMSLEEKKEYGPLFNKVKKQLEELFSNSLDNALNGDSDKFDPTINRDVTYGSLHPVTIIGRDYDYIGYLPVRPFPKEIEDDHKYHFDRDDQGFESDD